MATLTQPMTAPATAPMAVAMSHFAIRRGDSVVMSVVPVTASNADVRAACRAGVIDTDTVTTSPTRTATGMTHQVTIGPEVGTAVPSTPSVRSIPQLTAKPNSTPGTAAAVPTMAASTRAAVVICLGFAPMSRSSAKPRRR